MSDIPHDSLTNLSPKYPAELRRWAGHQSGGVRRLFDESSGRPNKVLLYTNLLERLESWARRWPSSSEDLPRLVLLIGGPGNGKTEAIEKALVWLDESLSAESNLIEQLRPAFAPTDGSTVPRLATADIWSTFGRHYQLQLVQDATVADTLQSGRGIGESLVREITESLENDATVYLSCINRGVLDEAQIWATENGWNRARDVLQDITRAIGLTPDAGSCWPLDHYPEIAIWPMDAESALVPTQGGERPPAEHMLAQALEEQLWPELGSCAAERLCPHCTSRTLLQSKAAKGRLLNILRYYELNASKRWTFRDLFSLVSLMLAGHDQSHGHSPNSPCENAAKLVADYKKVASGDGYKPSQTSALFVLVSSMYQHILFHEWETGYATQFARDLRQTNLQGALPILQGMARFLQSRKQQYLPATISKLLVGLCRALDPALAPSDTLISENRTDRLSFGDIDAQFSLSTRSGYVLCREKRLLSPAELYLIDELSFADTYIDDLLASEPTSNKRESLRRIQIAIRDYSCRLVRRSLGAKYELVQDAEIYRRLQQKMTDDEHSSDSMESINQEIELLLNRGNHFVVSLNTTFGQPALPPSRAARLHTNQRFVELRFSPQENRPQPPHAFLEIRQESSRIIPLTFDLFKSIILLRDGLVEASLPNSVVALLDTIRAQLAGDAVRGPQAARAKIVFGNASFTVNVRNNNYAVEVKR